MPVNGSTAALDEFELRPVTWFVQNGYASRRTFTRRIAEGRLPRRLQAGKYHWSIAEVRSALSPTSEAELSLREWAQLKAAEAPPLTVEQARVVVDAFAEALRS